ncbi:MAG: AAA family ATPase [Rhodopirellula sp.]|nr:AAA family ATPase [Rhodopirellula sp.]
MKNPAVWPDRPQQVECIETHISSVFLTRDFAWKIKKPVSFDFLDFSTLDLRKHFCEEELRLNQRTAPELYLEVVPICGSVSSPEIDGAGEPFEFALKMRRFDNNGLLSNIAARKRLTPEVIDDLAETIAAFHASIPRVSPESGFGRPEGIRRDALSNFVAIEELANGDAGHESAIRALHEWSIAEADRLENRFALRRAEGFVRECHGDLHLRNIFVIDGRSRLFDCVEFNESFRWIDVISEIAFLVMDLEEHGEEQFARRLLNRYLERTGDYGGLDVLKFYRVYRAMVRAKVDMIRIRDKSQTAAQRRALANEFGGYLSIAGHDAAETTPAILIMHGLSGSGKTAVSQRIVECSSAIRIRSDIERKRIHGIDETDRATGAAATRLYSPETTRQIYCQLATLAESVIQSGFPVIVDATFLLSEERAKFRELAARLGVPFRIIACTASEAELVKRVSIRAADNRDASDAGVAILRQQLATNTGIDSEPASQLITINTTDDAAIVASIDTVCRLIR